jgi:recombinational DNA repair protein (RecF pathway)
MSIFKSKWIIIKIDKMKPGEFLYTIFTKDYWKIRCNKKLSKQEKTLDLGYLINFEIYTKENVSIHKINNIKIISEFNHENKSFTELNNYLGILAIVLNKTPTGSPVYELFELLETINHINDINETKLILFKIKIISIFWELNETHNNETVQKILKFINANKIERILKLTWINEDVLSLLKVIAHTN